MKLLKIFRWCLLLLAICVAALVLYQMWKLGTSIT